jgi:uncharacterized glyoxalase superfamily protein PhnB
MVKNVNETVDFYRNNFGFSVIMSVPDEGDYEWAVVKCHDIVLMFYDEANFKLDYPSLKDAQPGGSFVLYSKVKDIDALYKKLNSKVDFENHLHTTFYGIKEFSIKDLNGYILTFSQDIG